MTILDAQDALVGRLAAQAAKRLLAGDEIVIVNAEAAALSGHRDYFKKLYEGRRTMQNKANPDNSPKQSWSRRPDLLLRRIVRGMLPKDTKRGRDALRKLRVYLGVPSEFEAQRSQFQAPPKRASALTTRKTTLAKLAQRMGWNHAI